MQSIYKQLRARFKFGAYKNKVGAEVFILSYAMAIPIISSGRPSILLHAWLHGVNHSFKHQHAIAGNDLGTFHSLVC